MRIGNRDPLFFKSFRKCLESADNDGVKHLEK